MEEQKEAKNPEGSTEDRIRITTVAQAVEVFTEAGMLLDYHQYQLMEAQLDEALALGQLVCCFVRRLP